MIRSGSHDRPVDLAESIVYLCALIADQPRRIDGYIDYFGETRSLVREAPHDVAREEMSRTRPDSSALLA